MDSQRKAAAVASKFSVGCCAGISGTRAVRAKRAVFGCLLPVPGKRRL